MIIESVIGIFVNQDWRIIKWVIFFMMLILVSLTALQTENHFQFPSLLNISRVICFTSFILFLSYFLQGMYFDQFFPRNSGRYLSQDFFWSGSAYAVFPTVIALPAIFILLKIEKNAIYRFLVWMTIVIMMITYFYFESRIGWLSFLGILSVYLIRFTKKEILYSSILLFKFSCIFFTGFLIFKTEVPNIISITLTDDKVEYDSWSDTFVQEIIKQAVFESNRRELKKLRENSEISPLEKKKIKSFIILENKIADHKYELSKYRKLLIRILGKDWGPNLKKEDAYKLVYHQKHKLELSKTEIDLWKLKLTQAGSYQNILLLTKKIENLTNEKPPKIFQKYNSNELIQMVKVVKKQIITVEPVNIDFQKWQNSKDYSVKIYDKLLKALLLIKEDTKHKNFGYWRDLKNSSQAFTNPEGSDLNRKLQLYAGFLRIMDNPRTFLIGDGMYSHRYTVVPIIKQLYKDNYDKMTESVIEGSRNDKSDDIKIFRTTGFTSLLIDSGVIGTLLFLSLFILMNISFINHIKSENKNKILTILLDSKLHLFSMILLINLAWFFPINITDNYLSYLLLIPNGLSYFWFKLYSSEKNV